ncbi:MAG: ABC transporter ATP-binding protein [Elusimicrobiota bacterium]
MTSEPAVAVRSLSYSYPGKSGPRRVLEDLSFEVAPGEIFGLLGPNGSGKTTAFRILATYFPSPEGTVRIFGGDAGRDPAAARRRFGVVFQAPSLDKRLTVAENLRHQGHLYGLRGSELSGRIEEELRRFGLSDRADDAVLSLSGGLQRRAELAKGLLHRPELLILDEPSTGLDPGARIDLWKSLAELKAGGTTILLTTHWMEEAERCDRLAILHAGRIVKAGSPAELKAAIGGDVISMESSEPEELCAKVRERFGGGAAVVDGTVRIEKPEGHRFIPQLVEAFPGLIRSITLGKPSLDDVFIRETGHKFWREENG